LSSSINNFESYYLYGLAGYNPFVKTNDYRSREDLYKQLVGTKGGIIIPAAFHPHQLVNQKGVAVWQAAFIMMAVNEKSKGIADAVNQGQAAAIIDPSDSFRNLNIWPDKRLTCNENSIFSKIVPYIIPFFVYNDGRPTRWDTFFELEMQKTGYANELASGITEATRFMMKEPSFVLGFDRFDEQYPSAMIDRFMSMKIALER
jgi:hypothetical protein